MEKDIISQLHKYCHLYKLKLNNKKQIENGFYISDILVIDTEYVYMYYDDNKSLKIVEALDNITTIDRIFTLRDTIITYLHQ